MIMYHGTTLEAFESIKKDGFLRAPVYLTPEHRIASDYAANNESDYVVICVDIDELLFCADSEFVSGEYADDAVVTSLENGSVYTECNISIADCSLTFYEDYEEVE